MRNQIIGIIFPTLEILLLHLPPQIARHEVAAALQTATYGNLHYYKLRIFAGSQLDADFADAWGCFQLAKRLAPHISNDYMSNALMSYFAAKPQHFSSDHRRSTELQFSCSDDRRYCNFYADHASHSPLHVLAPVMLWPNRFNSLIISVQRIN